MSKSSSFICLLFRIMFQGRMDISGGGNLFFLLFTIQRIGMGKGRERSFEYISTSCVCLSAFAFASSLFFSTTCLHTTTHSVGLLTRQTDKRNTIMFGSTSTCLYPPPLSRTIAHVAYVTYPALLSSSYSRAYLPYLSIPHAFQCFSLVCLR